jgi:hypothetical protein
LLIALSSRRVDFQGCRPFGGGMERRDCIRVHATLNSHLFK